jgi:hypothetical protein
MRWIAELDVEAIDGSALAIRHVNTPGDLGDFVRGKKT